MVAPVTLVLRLLHVVPSLVVVALVVVALVVAPSLVVVIRTRPRCVCRAEQDGEAECNCGPAGLRTDIWSPPSWSS
jgi:hypothetical protein